MSSHHFQSQNSLCTSRNGIQKPKEQEKTPAVLWTTWVSQCWRGGRWLGYRSTFICQYVCVNHFVLTHLYFCSIYIFRIVIYWHFYECMSISLLHGTVLLFFKKKLRVAFAGNMNGIWVISWNLFCLRVFFLYLVNLLYLFKHNYIWHINGKGCINAYIAFGKNWLIIV